MSYPYWTKNNSQQYHFQIWFLLKAKLACLVHYFIFNNGDLRRNGRLLAENRREQPGRTLIINKGH